MSNSHLSDLHSTASPCLSTWHRKNTWKHLSYINRHENPFAFLSSHALFWRIFYYLNSFKTRNSFPQNNNKYSEWWMYGALGSLQTQDSKFKPWWSYIEHAISQWQRFPKILNGWGGDKYLFLWNPNTRAGDETRGSEKTCWDMKAVD